MTPYQEEVHEPDQWSDDLKSGLEREINEIDREIREARKDAALAGTLADEAAAHGRGGLHDPLGSGLMVDRLYTYTGVPGLAAMNRQAILEHLNAEAPSLRKKYAVKSLGVFGSMARGDDHEGSDVDILVTFEGPATFDNFMGLKLDLEDLLGRRIDLGTPKTLRPEMRAAVERDLINVP